jgi:hypothetical protein
MEDNTSILVIYLVNLNMSASSTSMVWTIEVDTRVSIHPPGTKNDIFTHFNIWVSKYADLNTFLFNPYFNNNSNNIPVLIIVANLKTFIWEVLSDACI